MLADPLADIRWINTPHLLRVEAQWNPRALGTDKVRGRVRMTTKSFYRVAEPEAHYRRCPDWYELQPRPRGNVLNPHMRCWWVRGP